MRAERDRHADARLERHEFLAPSLLEPHLAAIGMLAWGLSGVVTGRVVVKSYGTIDGRRVYYRVVRRAQEPLWFWTVSSVYMALGIVLMAVLSLLS